MRTTSLMTDALRKRPKMILFDYGQTLVAEATFDGIKGTEAVLAHAVENRRGLTAEQVQQEAKDINCELNRFDPAKRAENTVEIPNHMFTAYLYESLGLKIDLSAADIDRVFWDAGGAGTRGRLVRRGPVSLRCGGRA